MKAKPELTIEMLRLLISYCPDTGVLTWKARTPDMFSGSQQSPEHSCKIWNVKYAGKPALAAFDGRGYGFHPNHGRIAA